MAVGVDQLKKGAKHYACAELLSRCSELHRQEIYNTLEHERLVRKYRDIERLFNGDALSNWNQLFYLLFMRTLGDEINKEVFMEVARRVPMKVLLLERSSVLRVEAILMGASGLLASYSNREYAEPMISEAKYLLHKHTISPISANYWSLGRVRPVNHPVVRLSQVAEIICSREFMFNDMLACQSRKDVDELFTAKTSKHFAQTHPHLMREGQEELIIGSMKRNLIGINVVVPMQYAYGCYTCDDTICARAQDLNETLGAESNRYIKEWQKHGINPMSAFESQALIQLTTQYCKLSRCEECPVGRRVRKGVL